MGEHFHLIDDKNSIEGILWPEITESFLLRHKIHYLPDDIVAATRIWIRIHDTLSWYHIRIMSDLNVSKMFKIQHRSLWLVFVYMQPFDSVRFRVLINLLS